MECPKCGHECFSDKTECEECGIVFEKYHKYLEGTQHREETRAKSVSHWKLFPTREERVAQAERMTQLMESGTTKGKILNGLGVLLLLLIMAPCLVPAFVDTGLFSTAKVRNAYFDGGVAQVEYWLKRNLKDPGSLEIIEWGKVNKLPYGYSVTCEYRAKNSFGGYVVNKRTFFLDAEGNVLKADGGRN